MKAILSLVLLTLMLTNGYLVEVNDSTMLTYYLCSEDGNNHLTSGSVLSLSSAHHYTIPPIARPYCLLQNLVNITLTSTGPAHITCTNDTQPTLGFGFFNITNLTLDNIFMHGCGGYISSNSFMLSLINNSLLRTNSRVAVPKTQTAVLSIIECSGVTISNVVIDQKYLGYAAIIINTIGNIEIRNSQVKNSSNCSEPFCQGSGMVVLCDQNSSTTLSLSKVYFTLNSNKYLSKENPLDNLFHGSGQVDLFGAGGLTVIATTSESLNIHMNKVTFKKNEGNLVGGCLILHYSPSLLLNVDIKSSIFLENKLTAESRGAGIAVFLNNYNHMKYQSKATIKVYLTSITKNSGAVYGSGMYMQLPNSRFISGSVHFTKCFLLLNNAKLKGHALYFTRKDLSFEELTNSRISITIHDSLITRNGMGKFPFNVFKGVHLQEHEKWALSTGSALEFVKLIGITISGKTNITFNAGSAVATTGTNVTLSGPINFKEGYAKTASHIRLEGLAQVIFRAPLTILFGITNGLYPSSRITAIGDPYGGYKQCPFQFEPGNGPLFVNFSIGTDNYLYSDAWSKCNMSILSDYFSNGTLEHISSPPVRFCICNSSALNNTCDTSFNHTLHMHPGQTLALRLSAKDYKNNSIATMIQIHYSHQNIVSFLNKSSCTEIKVPVFKRREEPGVRVRYMLTKYPMALSVKVKFLTCPPGFQLQKEVRESDYNLGCVCHQFFLKHGFISKCNIDTSTVTSSRNSWLGNVSMNSNESTFGYASVCPVGYCITNYTEIVTSVPDYLCQSFHTGILCGSCITGYSKVLGSNKCTECFNFSFLFILLMLILGIGLVLALFLCKLTVSDTLFGSVIFYASMTEISLRKEALGDHHQILNVFFSFLNISLGFPLCIYNGLTSIMKTAFLFIYPVYIWLIVIVLIIVSKRFTFVSNLISHLSVQVLATLFYLSFTKLLSVIIYVFLYATVKTPYGSYVVWYGDGNVSYWKNKWHICLMCVAILMSLLYILPFLFWTTCASAIGLKVRCLRMRRNLIDAYHGIYREGWGWLCGAKLWILVIANITYSILQSRNTTALFLIYISLLFPLMYVQVYFKPYRNKWFNFIGSILLHNLLLLEFILLYFSMKGDIAQSSPFASILLYSVLVILFGSVFVSSRVIKQTKLDRKLCIFFNRLQFASKFLEFVSSKFASKQETSNRNETEEDFREPLLNAPY